LGAPWRQVLGGMRSAIPVLAGMLTVAACSAGSAPIGTGASRTLDGQPLTPCTVSGEIPVKAEADGLCGSLRVPEDRTNPAGRQIDLRVVVIPAVAADPAPDAFVALAGGPGDAGTQFFAWLPGLYSDVHATHDIVLLDQRGTGASNPLVLPAMPDVAGLAPADAEARRASWAADALASLPGDPRFYTSTVAADDLDAVRQALRFDQVDLYGTSYGGELAQYYLRQHAEHVRVAIIDGSTPLDVPVLERIAASSQHALDLLLARCSADAACHGALPGLTDEWAALAARLTSGVTTNVADPDTGGLVVANLAAVGPGIHHALLTESTAARLPLAIDLAYNGRWDQGSALVPAPPTGGDTLAMGDEILCSERWARFDPAEVQRLGVGSYALPMELAQAQDHAARCGVLPSGIVPADDAAPVTTDVPILWLTGDGDPQDPPDNLLAGQGRAPNSRIVVVPAQEHVVGHLGCGPSVIGAFVDAGTADGLDASCLENRTPGLEFAVR
jgi:pimeloyl-ACP methyl ester carboxylesterase